MHRAFLAALLAAVTLTAPGCCWAFHAVCPCDPAPSAWRMTRETPDAALDYLVESFKSRRKADIYDTFHPDFRHENGDFTQEQFAVAFDRFEADFAADARSMEHATRVFRTLPNGDVLAELTNQGTGAYFALVLANRPQMIVLTKDPFVGEIKGPVDKRGLVRLRDGRLGLPSDFPLSSLGSYEEQTLRGVTAEDILRVEITDSWLVRSIDTEHSRGIRFLDKIKEHTSK